MQRGDLIHGAFHENDSIYLVISHPCDILNAKELSIEMIGCKAIESDNPLLPNGRNPRTRKGKNHSSELAGCKIQTD